MKARWPICPNDGRVLGRLVESDYYFCGRCQCHWQVASDEIPELVIPNTRGCKE